MKSSVHSIVQHKHAAGPSIVCSNYPVKKFVNHHNALSPAECYQQILVDSSSDSEFLIYIHDDVTIYEHDWLTNIEDQFKYMDAVVVGLGGAPKLGHHDIYKTPYHISQMARAGYMSNQRDWQVHGSREAGFQQVAVIDAFFMAIRREFILDCGGWPTDRLTHHCLDLWVCLEAARRKKKVMMVGIDCLHHGGGMSVGEGYAKAGWLQGGSREEDHARPHAFIYNEYRDVLPLSI